MDYSKIEWLGEESRSDLLNSKNCPEEKELIDRLESFGDLSNKPIKPSTMKLIVALGSLSLLKDAMRVNELVGGNGYLNNQKNNSELLLDTCKVCNSLFLFKSRKKRLEMEKRYLSIAKHLIDSGADVNYLSEARVISNGGSFYDAPIFHTMSNLAMMDLLLLHGADVNAGSTNDIRATDKNKQTSLLVNWFEEYESKNKKDFLLVLKKLKNNGIDFNQPIRGWRFSDNKHNFLCEAWRIYNYNFAIDEAIKIGVDPYQKGPNNVSLHDMLRLNSIMKSTNDDKISYKQRARAEKMLEWLESNYPPPKKSAKIKI